MLSAKRKSDGQTVTAYFESKRNAPFLCPDCSEEVILKTGKLRVNYFAHANPIACRNGEGESEVHRRCKMEIYEALKKETCASDVGLERCLTSVRADVCARINGVPVAIEIQISSLSLDAIMRRTIEYAREGIYVLWLLPWTPKLESERYTPQHWERWIHAAYFGRVYYWLRGLSVVSYRFEANYKVVPRKTWYSTGGEEMSGGGYVSKSKRYRTAVRCETLNIATDFAPRERYWWEGGGIKIPDAKLFMHRNSQMRSSTNRTKSEF